MRKRARLGAGFFGVRSVDDRTRCTVETAESRRGRAWHGTGSASRAVHGYGAGGRTLDLGEEQETTPDAVDVGPLAGGDFDTPDTLTLDQNQRLPYREGARTPDQGELEMLVGEWLESAPAWQSCARPEGALFKCLDVSANLAHWLKQRGVEARVVNFKGPSSTERMHRDWQKLLSSGLEKQETVGHDVVEVGPFIVDLTARHFDADAPFPLIEDAGSFAARWRMMDRDRWEPIPEWPLVNEAPKHGETGHNLKELDRGRVQGPMGPYNDWANTYADDNASEGGFGIHMGASDVDPALLEMEIDTAYQLLERLPKNQLGEYPDLEDRKKDFTLSEGMYRDPKKRGMTAQRRQPTIAVDLDGTIVEEQPGWAEKGIIGEPLPGAMKALRELESLGWKILIFTARFAFPGDHARLKQAIEQHLRARGVPFHEVVTGPKPAADYYVDNRAISFTGDWDEVLTAVTETGVTPPSNPDEQHEHDHESGTGLVDWIETENDFGSDGMGTRRDRSVARPPEKEKALF